MRLFAEFHLIQNFAPSNLNRDDTGSPKDAIFGGVSRARVSSQCQKRGIRTWVRDSGLIDAQHLATRTVRLQRLVDDALAASGIAGDAQARFNEIVKLAIKKKSGEKSGTSSKDSDSTLSYLLFLSPAEVQELREVISAHAPTIVDLVAKKKLVAKDISDELKEALRKCFRDKPNAVDMALFGRMLTDLPERNQDAACQLAHALATHRLEREFDYFTAVDDLRDPSETGAPMVSYTEFNSATFYRYAVLDVPKLLHNLDDDEALAMAGVRAFAEAMARAVPTGKQNSFAAHNPPAFVGIVLRHSSPFNLANAFEKPVVATRDGALTDTSVQRLGEYEQRVAAAYGDTRDAWGVVDLTSRWPDGLGTRHASLGALVDWLDAEVRQRLATPA